VQREGGVFLLFRPPGEKERISRVEGKRGRLQEGGRKYCIKTRSWLPSHDEGEGKEKKNVTCFPPRGKGKTSRENFFTVLLSLKKAGSLRSCSYLRRRKNLRKEKALRDERPEGKKKEAQKTPCRPRYPCPGERKSKGEKKNPASFLTRSSDRKKKEKKKTLVPGSFPKEKGKKGLRRRGEMQRA